MSQSPSDDEFEEVNLTRQQLIQLQHMETSARFGNIDYQNIALDRLLRFDEESENEKRTLKDEVKRLTDTIRRLYGRNQVLETEIKNLRKNSVASTIGDVSKLL